MSAVLHAHDQALFVSTTKNTRIDLMRGTDGCYDEFGDAPQAMMALGMMNTNRPLMMWNHNTKGNYTTSQAAWPGETKRDAVTL
jgi:hypothetical protein